MTDGEREKFFDSANSCGPLGVGVMSAAVALVENHKRTATDAKENLRNFRKKFKALQDTVNSIAEQLKHQDD